MFVLKITIAPSAAALGSRAAEFTAEKLRTALAEKGTARIVLSTGASQLDTIASLLEQEVDWGRVEMFHLDEYVGLPPTHKASFRKYLRERFTSRIPLRAVHWVEETADCIPVLTNAICSAPVDVGLIGIGENAHIAFNDPPADFQDPAAYKVVTLDDGCKRQQVGEGWFPLLADVPPQAITMTVSQIMKCNTIISCAPNAVKVPAIAATLSVPAPDTMVPASILKTHPDFNLYVDAASWNDFDESAICVPAGAQCEIERV